MQYYNNNSKNKIKDKIFNPLYGVVLKEGLFLKTFDNNRAFLKTLNQDSILYHFRRKAERLAPGEPYHGHFEDNLHGQTAGLFLMGAGNSLRWEEDKELRRRLDEIVDEIQQTAESDGYLMAIPQNEFGTKEYPHYVRIWLTYGLTAAAQAGNPLAFELIRKWQIWFNHCDDLSIIKYLMLSFQGVVASTFVYNTPIGEKEDIDTTIEYYEEDWRLGQYIMGERDAINHRNQPGVEPHPHGTEIEAMEGYLDLYRATGKHYYLRAVQNFYKFYKEDWQYPGSGIAMCEFEKAFAKCYWLSDDKHYNELCCSSFWLLLNQRFHRLFPEEESYINEMEATIYNIGIANQDSGDGIRYFAFLDKKKEKGGKVHCCCGVGTKMYGSLPEYIYSINESELYIDLFASSEITWERSLGDVIVNMETDMPYNGKVALKITGKGQFFTIKIRVPSWVSSPVDINLNGVVVTKGTVGSYISIQREWHNDIISFELPFSFRVSRYEGAEQVEGYSRWAVEYGPLLMAFKSNLDENKRIKIENDINKINEWLIPTENSLIFNIKDHPDTTLEPYFAIPSEEPFTCYPLFK